VEEELRPLVETFRRVSDIMREDLVAVQRKGPAVLAWQRRVKTQRYRPPR
jgi:hypothetical protein